MAHDLVAKYPHLKEQTEHLDDLAQGAEAEAEQGAQ